MCSDYFILMRIGHGPTELRTCTHSRTLWRCLKMERGGCVWSTMLARISAENYTSKAGKAIWAKCTPLGCIFSLISTNFLCMSVCGVCMYPCACMCASVGQLGADVMDQSLELGVRIPPLPMRNTNLDCGLKLDPIWTPFLPQWLMMQLSKLWHNHAHAC